VTHSTEATVRLVSAPAEAPAPTDLVAHLRDRPDAGPPASLTAPVEPLLVDTDRAEAMCGISPATWYRLKSAQRTPAPVRLGGRVLYRVEDLRLFVRWGCPSRREFEARKAAENAGRR
jgi:hypothetical protein